MTFFKVNDPKNRKLIEDVIAKRAVIREADRRRKMGDVLEYEQLSRFFKPITKQVEKTEEKIEKGVRGLPGEIAKVLPRPINIMQPPPAYEPPFAGEVEIPEAEEKGEEKNIKLPADVEKIGNREYRFGDLPFQLDDENNILINNSPFSSSPKIYELLTDEKTKIKWSDLSPQEKYDFGRMVVDSGILYDDYENNFKINEKIKNTKRWKNIYSPIWYNRFLYMDDERKNSDDEKRHMFNVKNDEKKWEKTNNETKGLINSILKTEKVKFDRRKYKKPTRENLTEKTGGGLKKNYVTLPSNPLELVDRLTLLSGSKDAGNTGVYNEMVSICDELLKRKIIGKGQYKQFLSNI